MSRRSSILLVFLVSAIPASIFIFINFFFYRRGWHIDEKERVALYWILRILLSPILGICCLKLLGKTTNRVKLFIYHLLLFAAYNFVQVFICLLVWPAISIHFDGRYYNLFNTVKEESTIANLIIYSVTLAILYGRQYAIEKSFSLTAIDGLKKAVAEMEKQRPTAASKLSILSVKQGHRNIRVPVDEIYFLKSEGPYIKIITSTGSFLLNGRLYDICKKLPPAFLRIHRSQAINSFFVKEIKSLLNGDYTIIMKNDAELKGSRTYRDNIRSLLV